MVYFWLFQSGRYICWMLPSPGQKQKSPSIHVTRILGPPSSTYSMQCAPLISPGSENRERVPSALLHTEREFRNTWQRLLALIKYLHNMNYEVPTSTDHLITRFFGGKSPFLCVKSYLSQALCTKSNRLYWKDTDSKGKFELKTKALINKNVI